MALRKHFSFFRRQTRPLKSVKFHLEHFAHKTLLKITELIERALLRASSCVSRSLHIMRGNVRTGNYFSRCDCYTP